MTDDVMVTEMTLARLRSQLAAAPRGKWLGILEGEVIKAKAHVIVAQSDENDDGTMEHVAKLVLRTTEGALAKTRAAGRC